MISGRSMTAGLAVLTLIAWFFADLSAPAPDPWMTLRAIAGGIVSPDFTGFGDLSKAAGLTLAFAFCGVGLGTLGGLLAAPFYHLWVVRLPCIMVRALHEIFWAILLLNLTGLSPLTGVLAIALPYTGIFAKVFREYLDETDAHAAAALPRGVQGFTTLLWVRLPACLGRISTYVLYRLECGLRSSAVLGFVGLPTLGFHLESYFKQGHYAQATAGLLVFFLMILPLRHWARWPLMPVYLAASVWGLMQMPYPPSGSGMLAQFLQDLVPAPIRSGADWTPWLEKVLLDQALPGAVLTLLVSQLALGLTAAIATIGFPLIVRQVTGKAGAMIGHGLLVIFRSIPEYMLAFVLLQILGPSMLPAVLALSLHNGAIIAHLMGRHTSDLPKRSDAPRGLTFAAWEALPRMSGNFWALLLYRWEIILRETAIMGILGLGTLGFYVQANMEQLRLDRATLLLGVTILLTLAIDAISTTLRKRMATPPALRVLDCSSQDLRQG